jgi:hypothetical protein
MLAALRERIRSKGRLQVRARGGGPRADGKSQGGDSEVHVRPHNHFEWSYGQGW